MTNHTPENMKPTHDDPDAKDVSLDDEVPDDVAERPGTDASTHDHDDALADEWGEESFPSSDPPAHY